MLAPPAGVAAVPPITRRTDCREGGDAIAFRRKMNETRLLATVYLEDTDAQGIVYHANYLKYCERGRTEMLKEQGYSLGELQREGIRIVVFEMKLRFLHPAQLHDELEIRTQVQRKSEYRLVFTQEVYKIGLDTPLFVAESIVVTIDQEGLLCPLPERLLAN